MQTTPEQKQAAIHWLLTEGEVWHWNLDTGSAFAHLLRRGIDFEASGTPEFGGVMINSGQHDEQIVETVHARIVPLTVEYPYDSFEAYIPVDHWQQLVMRMVMAGGIAAGRGTEEGWHARVNQRWLAEIDRTDERAAAIKAAAEKKRAARTKA